jgi:hypothetical protein
LRQNMESILEVTLNTTQRGTVRKPHAHTLTQGQKVPAGPRVGEVESRVSDSPCPTPHPGHPTAQNT